MAEVVGWMCEAKDVIIVPGFGLCQGQAQYATAEISKILNKSGVRLRFGIHPVAGVRGVACSTAKMGADIPSRA